MSKGSFIQIVKEDDESADDADDYDVDDHVNNTEERMSDSIPNIEEHSADKEYQEDHGNF